ncbi:decapping and exoribonuclease protein-like isoform X2 [Ostrea edulis]|uniref:decapping and exoribonuclease protein-like isoform X2 n=1 Tax=Ostrea edulis TaxID=37623 RepID=UPI0024AE9854|nr:decapping and exoribonuclease protein-like isoform X2 [Ostrea edulis]
MREFHWINISLPLVYFHFHHADHFHNGLKCIFSFSKMKRVYEERDDSSSGTIKKKLLRREPTTATLHTRPIYLFKGTGNFPNFRQPSEIGCLSLDIQRNFYNDKSQLKHYVRPRDVDNVRFDLTKGYHNFIQKDENAVEFINDILKWICCNREKFLLENEKKKSKEEKEKIRNLHTDFVCWRGLLTKLLCTPYENRDGWLIAVSLYQGTYYMCEFDTASRKRQKDEMSDRQKEMAYWGWKFEQYVTADKPDGVPRTEDPVNNCEAYCTVVRSRLEKHSLLFSGEVDAVDLQAKESCKYVEFKTTRQLESYRQERNFIKFKLIKWWAQSFLVGIPTIVCGYRDDDGVVHNLEKMETLKIPHRAKDERDGWDPVICFNFLDKFLAHVKEICVTDDPRLFMESIFIHPVVRRDVLYFGFVGVSNRLAV